MPSRSHHRRGDADAAAAAPQPNTEANADPNQQPNPPSNADDDDPELLPADPTEAFAAVHPAPHRARRKPSRASPAPDPDPALAPSPAPETPLSFEFLNGPDDGVILPLRGSSVVVGRAPTATSLPPGDSPAGIDAEPPTLITIPSDPKLSRTHLLLYQRDHQWWARDLGSANGTLDGATGHRLPSDGRPLLPGETLRIGSTRFRLTTAPPTISPPHADEEAPSNDAQTP